MYEFRDYRLSLAATGRLLRTVDLDETIRKAEKFYEGLVNHLALLISKQPDLDQTFDKTATSWAEVFQYAYVKSINFILISVCGLLCGERLEYRLIECYRQSLASNNLNT
tara:strand:- start:279 stop:608 length:330 start_codon:yes stop_codon:yes gene_type:complete